MTRMELKCQLKAHEAFVPCRGEGGEEKNDAMHDQKLRRHHDLDASQSGRFGLGGPVWLPPAYMVGDRIPFLTPTETSCGGLVEQLLNLLVPPALGRAGRSQIARQHFDVLSEIGRQA